MEDTAWSVWLPRALRPAPQRPRGTAVCPSSAFPAHPDCSVAIAAGDAGRLRKARFPVRPASLLSRPELVPPEPLRRSGGEWGSGAPFYAHLSPPLLQPALQLPRLPIGEDAGLHAMDPVEHPERQRCRLGHGTASRPSGSFLSRLTVWLGSIGPSRIAGFHCPRRSGSPGRNCGTGSPSCRHRAGRARSSLSATPRTSRACHRAT